MNHPKRDESTKNQKDKKNKSVGKTGKYLANSPGKTERNFEKYQQKISLAKMDL